MKQKLRDLYFQIMGEPFPFDISTCTPKELAEMFEDLKRFDQKPSTYNKEDRKKSK